MNLWYNFQASLRSIAQEAGMALYLERKSSLKIVHRPCCEAHSLLLCPVLKRLVDARSVQETFVSHGWQLQNALRLGASGKT